ncbi:MAG: hydroxymethylglutaryl-CoA lyase [Actinomycetota bacterium]|nr:hydroxymethylglutaryl-CoA lyase [Actinomycetota bacterium]
MPDRVTIVEVGPRDGLQNEPATVPTAVKVEFIERLARCGLEVIEATSFVQSERVPQLADAAEVMAAIRRLPDVRYPAVVPNERGFDDALAGGADEIVVLTAASDAFCKANLDRTVDESLEMIAPVLQRASQAGLRARGSVSTVLGCPYQGAVPTTDVVRVTVALFELGCAEVSLGDTIGVGTPAEVRRLLDTMRRHVTLDRLAVHMHDTFGQGLANTLAAFDAGVTAADTSAGGLGGCPYAPGAAGNLATEDLVYALERSGIDTGVDLDALVDTTAWMASQLRRPPASRAAQAILAQRRLAAAKHP